MKSIEELGNVDDVWRLVEDPEGLNVPSPKVRLRYVKAIYQALGYDLTSDIAYALVSMDKAQLWEACAGGCKTTTTQIKVILAKLLIPDKHNPTKKINGKDILCLVYNKQNVVDIQNKQQELVTKLKLNTVNTQIDHDVIVRTMHSYCDNWRKQYCVKMGLVGMSFADDYETIGFMARALKFAYKELNMQQPTQSDNVANKLLSFYNLCRESLSEPSDLISHDKFIDLGLALPIVERALQRYEVIKARKLKYDYPDMLNKLYRLITEDKKVLSEIQDYYHYVIVDEVQDLTPIMWKIIKLITSNDTPLICVGDADQNIYRFRGADISEMLNFEETFGGKVFTLAYNRRCKKAILDEAIYAISENKLRFDKSLLGTQDGGHVELIPYSTPDGQLINIANRIKELSIKEQQKTVVCFRENSCAQLLADILEESEISFHSMQGATPFSYELYTHLFDIFTALEMPYTRECFINLYKVLPCSKKQLGLIFNFSTEKNKFVTEDPRKHFASYDYGSLMNISGFADVMQTLVDISQNIKNIPMCNYFEQVYGLLKKYFWNYKKSILKETSLINIFEDRVEKFFNSTDTYPVFNNRFRRRKSNVVINNEAKKGVAISTFHGLKGLEFNNVFVTFLDDEIFPNFNLVESKEYASNILQEVKESETRLWYVTLTRAVNKLYLYYNSERPSRYITRILNRNNEIANNTIDDFDDEPMSFISSNQDDTNAEMLEDRSVSDNDNELSEISAFSDQPTLSINTTGSGSLSSNNALRRLINNL